MIKLLLAIGLAGVLWPVDNNNETLGMRGMNISSTDILSAAHSIYEDVGSFCNRNAETCITGQQAFQFVFTNIKTQILEFQSNKPTSSPQDQTSD
ncbi:MAG: DUF5330 domain-containing protein [Rhizobiaceae bacterium]